MKTAKTFRLSEQAIQQLETLHKKTGTNETALVEIALALFEQAILQGLSPDRTFGGAPKQALGEAPKVRDPNEAMAQAEHEELIKKFPQLKGMQMSIPHRKKRKRK